MFESVRRWLRETIAQVEGEDEHSNVLSRGVSQWPSVVIPQSLALRTHELLRSFNLGRHGREGLVYWAGISDGRGGVVTTLVVPDADSEYGRVATTMEENGGVIRWLSEQNLVLLGQAHSHPPGAGMRHSPGDDMMTFSPFEGHVSVVVRDHAIAEDDFLESWGVHRFIRGKFRRIKRSDWNAHLRVVPVVHDRRTLSRCPGGKR